MADHAHLTDDLRDLARDMLKRKGPFAVEFDFAAEFELLGAAAERIEALEKAATAPCAHDYRLGDIARPSGPWFIKTATCRLCRHSIECMYLGPIMAEDRLPPTRESRP